MSVTTGMLRLLVLFVDDGSPFAARGHVKANIMAAGNITQQRRFMLGNRIPAYRRSFSRVNSALRLLFTTTNRSKRWANAGLSPLN